MTVSTHDQLLDAIRSLVERIVGPGRTPANSGRETRLGDGFWLDSVELLEVVIACENEFGIVFDEARDLEGGALETLGTLTDLVRSKLPPLRDRP
jgi:acyl carrier protein